jgi:hypothetical protein
MTTGPPVQVDQFESDREFVMCEHVLCVVCYEQHIN